MSTTPHFGLKRINSGDSFQDESYKYTDADRETIDRLLYQALDHNHTGTVGGSNVPTIAPTLVLDDSAGSIPAGTRVYYKYTHVDSFGNETGASPETYVETSQAISSPAAPTLTEYTSSGNLLFGNYLYVVTAYVSSNTQETLAANPAWITVATGSAIDLTLPSYPVGADGFNIYRKRPGASSYLYLDSVTSGTLSYFDDGNVTEDSARTLPQSNTTNATNTITVSYPGGVVPDGYTWKIYRTYVSGSYTNSLLHHVVEETFSGSGIITPDYVDVGTGTFTGEPPASGFSVPQPGQIDLTDGAEVQGVLPPAYTYYGLCVTLEVTGTVTAGTRKAYWVSDYIFATIAGVRIAVATPPSSTSIIVDVNKGSDPTAGTTIFSTQANRPSIAVGQYLSTVQTPDDQNLSQGDVIVIDVDQAGGGATPNDTDLQVNLLLWVYSNMSLSSPSGWG